MQTRPFLPLTAATVTIASLAFAGPALASSDSLLAFGHGAVPGHHATSSSPALPSQQFAGYVDAAPRPSVKLTTRFAVPQIPKCGTTDKGIAPAVSTTSGNTNGFAEAGVFVGCLRGRARYIPGYAVAGQVKLFRSASIRPGDTIVLAVKGNINGISVSWKDKRTGARKTGTGPGASSYMNSEIVDFRSGKNNKMFKLPNFGKLTFSKSKLNGQPFGSFSDTRYKLVNSKGTVLIKTSPFAKDEESFKTVFEHS